MPVSGAIGRLKSTTMGALASASSAPSAGWVAATPAAPAALSTMVGALARAVPSSAAASATVKR
jgi:hypothetical protein